MTNKSQPHTHNGRFYNKPGEQAHHVLIPSAIMYIRSWCRRWFGKAFKQREWYIAQEPMQRSEEPVITWIGHATFLIQVGGLNILTDPLFTSPSLLFRRILPPGIPLKKLPPIDVVLISHNHPDHMSATCLRYIKQFQPQVLVPKNLARWFVQRGFSKVRDFMWWDSVGASDLSIQFASQITRDERRSSDRNSELHNQILQSQVVSNTAHLECPAQLKAKTGVSRDMSNITFTFLPAWHWSQRTLFDRNKTLWGSWMISYNGHNIYFGGDTSYAGHFKEIGQEFGQINTALLPIGPCEPKKWMDHVHMSAHKSTQAFLDLNAQQMIPMHWGTFHFGIDQFDTPIKALQNAWQQKEVEAQRLVIAKVGQQVASAEDSPSHLHINPHQAADIQSSAF